MSWAEEELCGVDLGDQRLNKRAVRLLADLGAKPTCSIPAACGGWNETAAAYRLFDHPEVTPEKLLAPHLATTMQRMKEHPVVLLVQDTTEMDYTDHSNLLGMGPLAIEPHRGMFAHLSLAVTPQRLCLGVVGTQRWVRADESLDQAQRRHRRKHQPIATKESHRWLVEYQRACGLAEQLPGVQLVEVSDRESDIYEIFVERQKQTAGPRADFIIRSNQDRSLRKPQADQAHQKLWAQVGQSPVLGEVEFKMPATAKRSARVVRQQVRACEVMLKAPQRAGQARLPDVKVNAVLLQETHPPEGEEAVEWLLLTSLPVGTFALACLVTEYYLCRWEIEVYFKVLKSGCRAEKWQFEERDRLENCLALYQIIAWRVLFLVMLARVEGEMKCTVVFSEEEWQSTWRVLKRTALPKQPPTLKVMVEMVGSLGGHLNRSSDGPLGVKRMWLGLQRVKDIALGWQARE